MKSNSNFSLIVVVLVIVVAMSIFAYGLWRVFKSAEVGGVDKSLLITPETKDLLKETKSMDQQTKSNSIVNVVMKTSLGDIGLELYKDKAPNTVANFVKLVQSNFYNGTKFHRVIKGFMIQGGDPNSRNADWSTHGMGGPGYKFDDEINDIQFTAGVLAMANSGPNTNGSQFFIVTADNASWLFGHYTAFGRVTSGMDTVTKIENVKTDPSRNDHPLDDVIVDKVIIE